MTNAFSKFVRRALAGPCFRRGSLPARTRGFWPLLGAAFWMSLGLNILWTPMPFIIRNMGGTEEHVGYSWAAYMFGYLLCLLFTGAKLGHLDPRRTTRAASAIMFVAMFVMLIVVYNAMAPDRLGSMALILTVIAAGTVVGGAMSLYWPYLMTWVSADYEGAVLNRRLGTYNGMWSAAGIIGPVIGGLLVEWQTSGPIAVGAGSMAICLLLLSLANQTSVGGASTKQADAPEQCLDENLLLRSRWIARIGLFCSWLSMGVLRSQFALLFTEIGFTERQFGVLVTTFGICNFLTVTGAGRLSFWHFKPALLLAAQSALAVSVLLLIFGSTLLPFTFSFVVTGCAFGFAYSSHLYYGACGSKNRSKQMSIHEATLSLGIIVGSGSGGYLAGNYGTYWPYWFALIVLALGLGAQGAIWMFPRKN